MARSRISKSPEKSGASKWFKTISPPITPTSGPSPGTSPRTSPGLLAGHYAGCKFTEPPAPSALPQPPKHWTQDFPLNHHLTMVSGDNNKANQQLQQQQHHHQSFDIAHQLKVLLKVQA